MLSEVPLISDIRNRNLVPHVELRQLTDHHGSIWFVEVYPPALLQDRAVHVENVLAQLQADLLNLMNRLIGEGGEESSDDKVVHLRFGTMQWPGGGYPSGMDCGMSRIIFHPLSRPEFPPAQ